MLVKTFFILALLMTWHQSEAGLLSGIIEIQRSENGQTSGSNQGGSALISALNGNAIGLFNGNGNGNGDTNSVAKAESLSGSAPQAKVPYSEITNKGSPEPQASAPNSNSDHKGTPKLQTSSPSSITGNETIKPNP